MPKRILDPAYWRSTKLARVQPESFRLHYANWIPLASAAGSFEFDARCIWSSVYAYLTPGVSVQDVEAIADEFERVGLLFRWSDAETGKVWAYFVGIDKPGRLPPQSRLRQGHEFAGPTPPAGALERFVSNGQSPARTETLSALKGPTEPDRSEEILAIWNGESGPLPKVKRLTSGRRAKIRARFASDPSFLDSFRTAVGKCVATPFLRGEGNHGWRATFDWLIHKDDHVVRVLEGAYAEGKPKPKGKGVPGHAAEVDSRNIATAGFAN